MDKHLIAQLYSEEDIIAKRIIIDNMLLSKLGFKNCSSITIPRDLTNGQALAEDINKAYQEKVEQYESKFSLKKLSLSPRGMIKKAVRHKQDILRKVCNEKISADESYHRVISWAKIIGLLGIEFEVRPSIREMLFIAEPEKKKEIERLMHFRAILKKDAQKTFNEKTPVQVLLYPEELNPRYVEEIGKITGYPECCIRAFMEDRRKGDNPHIRAALDFYKASKNKKPEVWAYYTGEFAPCRTDCRAAQDLGKKAYEKLSDIDKNIAEDYKKMLGENRAVYEKSSKSLQNEIVKMQKVNEKNKK